MLLVLGLGTADVLGPATGPGPGPATAWYGRPAAELPDEENEVRRPIGMLEGPATGTVAAEDVDVEVVAGGEESLMMT